MGKKLCVILLLLGGSIILMTEGATIPTDRASLITWDFDGAWQWQYDEATRNYVNK